MLPLRNLFCALFAHHDCAKTLGGAGAAIYRREHPPRRGDGRLCCLGESGVSEAPLSLVAKVPLRGQRNARAFSRARGFQTARVGFGAVAQMSEVDCILVLKYLAERRRLQAIHRF